MDREVSEPAGTERAPAEVAGNTFHGPTAFQQGDGNIQYNYYGPDLGALRARWLQSYLPAARRAARDYHYPGVSGATPPLAAVYVRQQVTSAEVDRRPGAQDLPLLATLREVYLRMRFWRRVIPVWSLPGRGWQVHPAAHPPHGRGGALAGRPRGRRGAGASPG